MTQEIEKITRLAALFTPPASLDQPVIAAAADLDAARADLDAARDHLAEIAKHVRPGEDSDAVGDAMDRVRSAEATLRSQMDTLAKQRPDASRHSRSMHLRPLRLPGRFWKTPPSYCTRYATYRPDGCPCGRAADFPDHRAPTPARGAGRCPGTRRNGQRIRRNRRSCIRSTCRRRL